MMASLRRSSAGQGRAQRDAAEGSSTGSFTAARTLGPSRHDLPLPATSFVGRQMELAKIRELLSSVRLLTLSGAGGCGKTRLALEAAADCHELYSGGTWFVDLAPVSDPNQVVPAVATAVGFREQPGRSLLETAIDYLQPRHALLVLDNCEHVVEACAWLVESLTRAAPLLTVLATSREPLGVAGEMVYRVPPLDEAAAVQLFEQRARQRANAFVVTSENASTVTAICSRLDHIPLAIELAAPRVALISPHQILERLDQRFQLLTGGPRTALPRHQTLAATVEWSHGLLSPEERALFRRLSVFSGGFSLDAAEAVCSDEGSHEPVALDLLGQLVDKSLIEAGDAAGARGRYGMLETMRQFALELLVESGEASQLRERHARYFFELADRWPPLGSADEATWLIPVEAEQDNLRQALSWLRRNDPGSCLRMAGRLLRFWDAGRYSEGRALLHELLGLPDGKLTDRALALVNLGRLAAWSGDWAEAKVTYEDGLQASVESANKLALSFALIGLGNVALHEGDRTTARHFYERVLVEAEPRRGPSALNMLGTIARLEGDNQLARSFLARGAAESERFGELWHRGYALRFMADLELLEHRPAAAAKCLADGIELVRPFNDPREMSYALQVAAEIALYRGQHHRALRLASAARALKEWLGLGGGTPAGLHAELNELVEQVRVSVGSEAAVHLEAEGSAMTLDQALDYALSADEKPPLDGPQSPGRLSRRELEVAAMVAEGMSNREIAARLFIAERTAEGHVEHIRNKLGFHSRVQIAAWAMEQGLPGFSRLKQVPPVPRI